MLETRFTNLKVIEMDIIKTPEKYKQILKELLISLQTSTKVFISLATVDDAKLIQAACNYSDKLTHDKLIVLLHNTPTLLDNTILHKLTILGTCSYHRQSFYTDIDLILGKIVPKSINNLTISIGDNGSFYNSQMNETNFTLAQGYSIIPFYATNLEKELTQKNNEKQDVIYKLILIIIILIIMITSLCIFYKTKSRITDKYSNSKIKEYFLKHLGKNILSIGIFIFIIVLIFYLSLGIYSINGDPRLYRIYTENIPKIIIFIEKPLYTIIGISIICIFIYFIAIIFLYSKEIRNIFKRDE